jgi:hypothetical protein
MKHINSTHFRIFSLWSDWSVYLVCIGSMRQTPVPDQMLWYIAACCSCLIFIFPMSCFLGLYSFLCQKKAKVIGLLKHYVDVIYCPPICAWVFWVVSSLKVFWLEFLYALLISSMCAAWPAYLIILDLITLTFVPIKSGKLYSRLKYTYFSNVFLANLHTLLALVFIYCRHKSVAKLIMYI